ncbi:MAG: cysteine--tRNA ligase [Candidatus Micrarchaeaceae archaeon]
MQVYNTLTRAKEEFVPLKGNDVHMFVCGQTVYDDAHLGHAKTYISFDVVARWLRHMGYNLEYVQNITDIDDKIIARAKERGIPPIELARHYESRFMEDMERIGVKKTITVYARSHDYIDAMREQIQTLLDKGYAYRLEDDIYYDISKFSRYTEISGMKVDELEKHRIEPRAGKKNVYDFALWKAPKEGEPSWTIKLDINGNAADMKGRPGWHIEDTATTATLFGPRYDLHGGALELLFPHHSNEIAQAEAAYDVHPFVKYWLHSGVLNIKGTKMSKSLKNFITIREALEKYEPEALRLMILATHYRKEVNYEGKSMDVARNNLRYMYSSLSLFYNMKVVEKAQHDGIINDIASGLETDFTTAMSDDFNTPLATTKLIIAIRALRGFTESHTEIGRAAMESAMAKLLSLANTLGILEKDTYKEKLSDDVHKLINARESLRKEKRFKEADEIRSELKAKHGITLEDMEYGTVWYKE